jgi:hypothetical protein
MFFLKSLALVLLSLCLPFCSLTAGEPGRKPSDPAKAKLIVQGKGFLIHALSRAVPVTRGKIPEFFRWGGGLEQDASPEGLILLYTDARTGEMKSILSSGRFSVQGPPMGIDRVYHSRTRILGTTVDGARLYVAWGQASAVELLQGQPPRVPKFGRGAYSLLVFDLKDGRKIQALDLKGDDLPKELPAEAVGRGPLQVEDGGVSCLGSRFAVRDGRLEPRRGPKQESPK